MEYLVFPETDVTPFGTWPCDDTQDGGCGNLNTCSGLSCGPGNFYCHGRFINL